MLIIRKYPNRRLYNTDSSTYITLEDVKAMVLGHQDFCVLDSKTNEDLTQGVLLQIITEQEVNASESLLTNALLKRLIRFYGNGMQGVFGSYLEQSVESFLGQQEAMNSLMHNMVEVSPFKLMGKLAENNLAIMSKLMNVDGEKQKRGKQKKVEVTENNVSPVDVSVKNQQESPL